jgi:stress response protein YsnF
MTTTLIGVFDDVSQARQAAETVHAAGIDRDRIDVRADSSELPAAHEDRRGFFARLFGLGDDDDSSSHYGEAVRRGSAVVSVSLADDSRTDEICELLEQCGAADVDERVEQWKTDGYAPMARPTGAAGAGGQDQTLQSVEEELEVGKREVHKGRVRVHRTTTETPVEEAVTLREEKAQIDRRPVDRPATESEMQTAFEDQDIEIVETAEEPVVSKSARVVEEVTVGKKVSERTESVRDKVRSTRVDVDHDDDADTPGGTPAGMRRYAGPERRTASGLRYAGVAHSPDG